ncbi:MAG: DNA methyltransferase, partial [Planctomycetota bacterium]
AEAYKDVVYEESIKIGGATKAPDYCFRIGGTRKFFVETKKPSVKIKDDKTSAFQLRRYAWSAKLPLSILTNFHEFAVYEYTRRPNINDNASVCRIIYFTADDYSKRWNEISNIFSRESILKGSFDKYAQSVKSKRGTAEVDSAFLKEIENWRESLARNIILRNPELTHRQLNFSIQRTIDRLIFLRICEDRGVETYGTLHALLNGKEVYKRLFNLFHRADERYNSGLFHFQREKERNTSPDELTPKLNIDDKILKEIIKNLYYPESPYEFSVLPADILGQVYEQFLGKVIRITSGHRAVVEDKPEVKKAGGVYYTPTYIVDYIVKNTVGKLLEGKTPKQAAKLRILDPACGSGSFLIGAYQYLLDWHRNWYENNGPEKYAKGKSPKLYQSQGGDWRLTTAERKNILLNNIYGVDIDTQAVEVTKLSLLLKVLEGENQQTLDKQRRIYHERALPDLGNNIKCGNSLIGPDFYKDKQKNLFDDEEQYRINAFDWHTEFPEIFKRKNSGFDAVIGNPPYIGFHGFKEYKDYLRKHFETASGKFDYYIPFIERGINLLRGSGLLSFICPTNFTKRSHGQSLREILKKHISIIEICDFQDSQIFVGALNYTGIFIFEKTKPNNKHILYYKQGSLKDKGFYINQSSLTYSPWVFRDNDSTDLVKKIKNQHVSPLKAMSYGISEGIVTGLNDVFLISKREALALDLENDIIRPCVRGKDIRRYYHIEPSEVVIYPYRMMGNKTIPFTEKEVEQYKNTWSYLTSRRCDLSNRKYFNNSTKLWFELWCQRNLQLLSYRKIVVPELSESNRFSIADESIFYGDTVCGITLLPETKENLLFVLGLLNSKLIQFYYQRTTVPKANKFYIYKTMFLKELPIHRIDFSKPTDKSRHDKMVKLVVPEKVDKIFL